ncbi:MAG: phospho-N-acetylmuramoyl-pentapeptide-transferase, partial [Desulfovibrio sp.]|nr:phospho-N-acetylmuramoyl-pentapeptide-transferase [Desulfovibrio sp.]
MFYYFLVPLAAEWSALNVFRYLSFRSMAALITALVISIFFGSRFINWLRRVKAGQYILEDVSVHASKAGTPTMGGLLIFFSLIISVFLWADLANIYVWQTLFVLCGFGAIGFWDDMSKLRHRQNRGISAKSKMAAQILVAAVAMYLLHRDPAYSSELYIPFFKEWVFDLGWGYFVLGVFIMVASSNAVNLTDGLDGLAIGPVIVACLVFSIFIYITGNAKFSQYLLVPYTPGAGEVTVVCAALVGSGLGFLWFNAYPAQVFMGDVGSLSLGGTLGFFALLCK